ncbi:MAG: hypothetical protein BWY76_02844 [bacterium ADurb.Bin429]|nr:MAG: hypothetical protein BWY76_02844 [bacterium ADurb.Bin429]
MKPGISTPAGHFSLQVGVAQMRHFSASARFSSCDSLRPSRYMGPYTSASRTTQPLRPPSRMICVQAEQVMQVFFGAIAPRSMISFA